VIEILNRYTKAVLYTSTTAETIAEAVRGAVLRGADLSGADLRGADLRGADLSGAVGLWVSICGSRDLIVALDAQRVWVGCIEHPIAQWVAEYEVIGIANKYSPEEYLPGTRFQSDDELAEASANLGTTIFHPVGTCKMGRADDPLAVTDPQLRVRGVERLRVIDASIMPAITSGNTNSPTLMIAERGAQVVKG